MLWKNILLVSLVAILSHHWSVSAAPIPSECCSSSRYACDRHINRPLAALAAQTMSSVSDWASWVSDWIPLLILNIPTSPHKTVKKVYSCHLSHHAPHHDYVEDCEW